MTEKKTFKICVVGFDSDNDHLQFSQQLKELKNQWDERTYNYSFDPLSVDFAYGGTHVVIAAREVCTNIEKDLLELLQSWPNYRLITIN
jgi:hypothetical protein